MDNLDIRLVRRFHWRRFRFLWRVDVKCDGRGWLPMRWQWDGETYEQMRAKLDRANAATWRMDHGKIGPLKAHWRDG